MKHEAIIELLPWYANESLDEGERQIVEEHLGACESCGRELAQWQQVGMRVRATEGEPELPPGHLNEVMARIDTLERERAEVMQRPGLGARLREFFAGAWQPLPGVARTALVAQLGLVVLLAGALVLRNGQPEAGFTTLSGPAAESTFARLQVGFEADLTEAELRATLLDVEAHIVAGPSAQGLYTIQLSLDRTRTEEVKVLAEALRNRAGIRFVGRAP